jgi:integrase
MLQQPPVISPTPQPTRAGRIAKTFTGRQRFRVIEFANAGGSKAFRVQGMTRDGAYVRKNYSDLHSAEVRQMELNREYLIGEAVAPSREARLTTLDDDQLRLAERAFARLVKAEAKGEDIIDAVEAWLKSGRKQGTTDAPRLDGAVHEFNAWLDATPALRERTKANLRLRVAIFGNSIPNHRLDAITVEHVEKYLAGRGTSPVSRDNDRRAMTRFFNWCKERPRNWLAHNPASDITVEKGEAGEPEVLTVEDCERLLRAAEAHNGGNLVPYLVVTMFAGLRPFEASRLDWSQVNLDDGEIRLEASQTKTGKGRVVEFNDGPQEQKAFNATVTAWLRACKGQEFFPVGWRKQFDKIKVSAGFGTPTADAPDLRPWPADVLRHTAISHYFRLTGSYGRTADQFGNSESVIRTHYKGKVSTADTARFYAIRPTAKPA